MERGTFMSIRAYRVMEIKTNGPSFNLWEDEDLVEWLDKKTAFFQSLNFDAVGLTEIDVDELKRALVEINDLKQDIRKAIEEDINAAEEIGRDYVQYYCI
jgi:hypothetical protein